MSATNVVYHRAYRTQDEYLADGHRTFVVSTKTSVAIAALMFGGFILDMSPNDDGDLEWIGPGGERTVLLELSNGRMVAATYDGKDRVHYYRDEGVMVTNILHWVADVTRVR